MRAVVPAPDADAPGLQEDVQGVQGRQAGRVGQTRGAEEGREERFEPGARGRREPGVDVRVERLRPLLRRRGYVISWAGHRRMLFPLGIGRTHWYPCGLTRGAYLEVFRGDQVVRVGGVAECGGDVQGGGYVGGAIELVVGVDGEGGRVVKGLG